MDLAFNELQQMLKSTARNLMRDKLTIEMVRQLRNDRLGYCPDLWASIASLGWIGLTAPEEAGGIGGDFVDAVVLFEEMGRSLLPSPFLSQWLAASVISKYFKDAFRQLHLPGILNGKTIVAIAVLEDDGQILQQPYRTLLQKAGHGYLLSGEKRFVIDGTAADGFLLTASQNGEAALVYVSAHDPRVSVTPLTDAARRRMALVRFHDVPVREDDMVFPAHAEKAMKAIWNLGALAVSAELTGASEYVLDAAIEYAKTRVQFGQPIGRFQAIQHKCANMKIDLEVCRHITQYAAWMLSERLPDAEMAVSQAKLLVSEASNRIVREGQQIFGGLGFTEEHFMPLYYRFIKEGRALFGLPDEHRRRIAGNLLDEN